jgi:hypothetical protein
VIKWKTQPTIQVTSLAMRASCSNTPGTAQTCLLSVLDKGTVTKPTPTTPIDIRIGFNASMDPTTLDLTDIKVESLTGGPVPTLALATASGCGTTTNATGWLATCSLRIRGTYVPGDYKITLVKDAKFKDIYGNEYTQAADQTATITVQEGPVPVQCL